MTLDRNDFKGHQAFKLTCGWCLSMVSSWGHEDKTAKQTRVFRGLLTSTLLSLDLMNQESLAKSSALAQFPHQQVYIC